MPFFLFAFSLLLVLFGMVFFIFEVYVIIIGHLKGGPFIRSAKKRIATMLELAAIQPGERVVDLGSGDGTLVLEAARRGAYATGVEINPFLVWYTRLRIKKAGLSGRASVIRGDLWRYPLSDTDVVLLYLLPSTMEKLKEKLARELPPHARIVSNAFILPDWTPAVEKNSVFLYTR